MFRNLKMRWKILLPICTAVVLIFAVFMSITLYKVRETSRQDAEALGREMAESLGMKVARDIDSALGVAQTLADVLAGAKEARMVNRKKVIGILRHIIEGHEELYGLWTTWEPDAFDRMDKFYRNYDKFTDENGRFAACWNREGGELVGGHTENFEEDNPLSAWYYQPLRTGRQYVTTPVFRKVDGKTMLTVSVSVPIIISGKVVGVAGADIVMDRFSDMVRREVLFDTGYGFALSNEGVIAAHPDAKKLGSVVYGLMAEEVRKPLATAVSKGRNLDFHMIHPETGKDMYYMFVPFKVGSYDKPWSFGVSIPTDEIMADANRLMLLCAGMSVGAVLLMVLIVVLVARTIVRPVNELAGAAQSVAAGDLEADIRLRQDDELGMLAEALRNMVTSLVEKIAEANAKTEEAEKQSRMAENAVREAEEARSQAESARSEGMQQAASELEVIVERVSSSSEELTAQVHNASAGAERQSRRSSEAATAMSQMNSSVLEVARNASDAADSTMSARDKADAGSEVVKSLMDSITQVSERSAVVHGQLDSLGGHAENIGRIMNVITDIADQTNLLALNAAIEAARAGDAGRGFAVVADEVRKLAEKTMQATKDVEDAVRTIQDGTRESRISMDEANEVVGRSTDLARNAGEALGEIVEIVETCADQVRGIAGAAEEQSAVSEEISTSVQDVNDISRETAESMTQSAEAIADLARQAAQLDGIIRELKNQ
jgi:methyl-accepting chemotaxis protein